MLGSNSTKVPSCLEVFVRDEAYQVASLARPSSTLFPPGIRKSYLAGLSFTGESSRYLQRGIDAFGTI